MPYTVKAVMTLPTGTQSFGEANPSDNHTLLVAWQGYIGKGLVSVDFDDPTNTQTTRTATFVFDDEASYNTIFAAMNQLPETANRNTYHTTNNITQTVTKTQS